MPLYAAGGGFGVRDDVWVFNAPMWDDGPHELVVELWGAPGSSGQDRSGYADAGGGLGGSGGFVAASIIVPPGGSIRGVVSGAEAWDNAWSGAIIASGSPPDPITGTWMSGVLANGGDGGGSTMAYVSDGADGDPNLIVLAAGGGGGGAGASLGDIANEGGDTNDPVGVAGGGGGGGAGGDGGGSPHMTHPGGFAGGDAQTPGAGGHGAIGPWGGGLYLTEGAGYPYQLPDLTYGPSGIDGMRDHGGGTGGDLLEGYHGGSGANALFAFGHPTVHLLRGPGGGGGGDGWCGGGAGSQGDSMWCSDRGSGGSGIGNLMGGGGGGGSNGWAQRGSLPDWTVLSVLMVGGVSSPGGLGGFVLIDYPPGPGAGGWRRNVRQLHSVGWL